MFHKSTAPPPALGKRGFQRIAEPAVAGAAGFQPINNDVDDGRNGGGGKQRKMPRGIILGGQSKLFLA